MELVSLALRLFFSKLAYLHHLFAHAIRITLNRTKAHTIGSIPLTAALPHPSKPNGDPGGSHK